MARGLYLWTPDTDGPRGKYVAKQASPVGLLTAVVFNCVQENPRALGSLLRALQKSLMVTLLGLHDQSSLAVCSCRNVLGIFQAKVPIG